MEKKLRRCENTLSITGLGVVALSVWSVLRIALFFILDPNLMINYFSKIVPEVETMEFKYIIIGVFIVLIVELLIRLYVGKHAYYEGHGKKRGYLYILISLFFLRLSVQNIIGYLSPDAITISMEDTISCIIFEITSIITLVELIYSSIAVKVLRRKINKEVEQIAG